MASVTPNPSFERLCIDLRAFSYEAQAIVDPRHDAAHVTVHTRHAVLMMPSALVHPAVHLTHDLPASFIDLLSQSFAIAR